MRSIAMIAVIAALFGCSARSMNDMRSNGAAKVYSSQKSESELSKCILFAWQDTNLAGGGAQAYIQPGRSGGTTVYTEGNEYFADLSKAGTSTKISYFEVGDTWISRKLQPGLESCL